MMDLGAFLSKINAPSLPGSKLGQDPYQQFQSTLPDMSNPLAPPPAFAQQFNAMNPFSTSFNGNPMGGSK